MLSRHSPFYREHCIQCRMPINACPCQELSSNQLPFLINICSHSNEWQRNDNTGQWALLSSPQINRYRWHRKTEQMQPKLPLDALTPKEGHYLLYPAPDSQDISELAKLESISPQTDTLIKQLWVIDGTWQEAKKMFKQSPWLQQLPSVSIHYQSSQFKLRRNQQGLSTMEAIEWAIRDYRPNDASADGLKDNFKQLQDTLLSLLR